MNIPHCNNSTNKNDYQRLSKEAKTEFCFCVSSLFVSAAGRKRRIDEDAATAAKTAASVAAAAAMTGHLRCHNLPTIANLDIGVARVRRKGPFIRAECARKSPIRFPI